MVEISTTNWYLFAIILPLFPAWYLHEGTHWFIGWLADTDPKARYILWVVPVQINHGKIETIESDVIRLLGLGIFIWLPVQILALGYLVLDLNPINLFMAMLPFYIVIGSSSQSDRLAIRDPETYRQLEIDGNLPGRSLFYNALKNCVR